MKIMRIKALSGTGDRESLLPRFGQLFRKMRSGQRSKTGSQTPSVPGKAVSPGLGEKLDFKA